MNTTRHTEKPPDDENDDEGSKPLTPEERAWVRHAMRDEAHATWLRGRIKVIWPWLIAVIGAAVAAVDWVQKHIRWTGP